MVVFAQARIDWAWGQGRRGARRGPLIHNTMGGEEGGKTGHETACHWPLFKESLFKELLRPQLV